MKTVKLDAYPYPFPLQGSLGFEHCAVLAIDFQIDFCAEGGYMHRMGVNLAGMRAALSPTSQVLAAARQHGLTVVHTRETFKADLSDVQPHRLYRGPNGTDIVPGDQSPLGRCLVEGEPCWHIVPEVAPLEGEAVFDKCAYGAFGCTEIESYLRQHNVRHLIFTGLTSNCCIQSNLREALDRGFECAVLEDCCGASSDAAHDHAMALVRNPSGVFGVMSSSEKFLAAVDN